MANDQELIKLLRQQLRGRRHPRRAEWRLVLGRERGGEGQLRRQQGGRRKLRRTRGRCVPGRGQDEVVNGPTRGLLSIRIALHEDHSRSSQRSALYNFHESHEVQSHTSPTRWVSTRWVSKRFAPTRFPPHKVWSPMRFAPHEMSQHEVAQHKVRSHEDRSCSTNIALKKVPLSTSLCTGAYAQEPSSRSLCPGAYTQEREPAPRQENPWRKVPRVGVAVPLYIFQG